MSDTLETPQPLTPPAGSRRRRFLRRAAIGTVAATLATGIGVAAFAHAHGGGGWHRGGFMGAHLDPAKLDEHLDRMLKHLYVEVDATDDQKQQLGADREGRRPRPVADAGPNARCPAAGGGAPVPAHHRPRRARGPAGRPAPGWPSRRRAASPRRSPTWPRCSRPSSASSSPSDAARWQRAAAGRLEACRTAILLIEDDRRLAEMVTEYLGEAGFSVSVAPDGRTGLARLAAEPYDALVLDLMLPDMDGLEVCRRLRAPSPTCRC